MRFSLSTGTLYIYPLRQVFRWARGAGFHGVELAVNPEAILRGGQRMRQIAQSEGTEILSVHPALAPLPGWRERSGGLDPTIRLAQEAGAEMVIMHVPHSESLDAGEGSEYRETIESWKVRLSDDGLRLAMENKAIRNEPERLYALSSLDRLRAFADCYDLDLVLDTVHAATAGEDLMQAWRTFGGRLANLHLSDMGGRVPWAVVPHFRWMLEHHRFPGCGNLPLRDLLGRMARSGYDGLVTLEVNPVAVRFWWPPAVRRYLDRAMAWMREAAGSEDRELGVEE